MPCARLEINTQAKVDNLLARVAIRSEVSSRWTKVVKGVSEVEIGVIAGRGQEGEPPSYLRADREESVGRPVVELASKANAHRQ